MNLNYRKYSIPEGKSLAKYLSKNPKSAKNPVFLSEVLNSFAQFVYLSENGFLKSPKKGRKQNGKS